MYGNKPVAKMLESVFKIGYARCTTDIWRGMRSLKLIQEPQNDAMIRIIGCRDKETDSFVKNVIKELSYQRKPVMACHLYGRVLPEDYPAWMDDPVVLHSAQTVMFVRGALN